jgi:Dyp-type peroxidase family
VDKPLALGKIQGNIIGGFNKDYETFLFLNVLDAGKARGYLDEIKNEIATSEEVLAFNRLFKQLRKRHGGELGILKATWTNIAFSAAGLDALKIKDLSKFPKEFTDGMAARKKLIGDLGESDPSNWIGPLGSKQVHAVLIVAADSQSDLYQQVTRYEEALTACGGFSIVFRQEGAVRMDDPGHEHFGFKDGVSQPGIRGVDKPTGEDPDQGNPGQDLLHAGEFVLGYATQTHDEKPGHDGPNPDPGPISENGPTWTENGSYMVFRRLAQDVEGFHNHVKNKAAELGMTPELLGAKLVGRFASGCPLEKMKPESNGDSLNFNKTTGLTEDHLDIAENNQRNNFFEYGADPGGTFVPRPAHIRKAYPRDQAAPDIKFDSQNESQTQTHRLLRRGIPFGTSFRPTLGAASHTTKAPKGMDDRGLIFVCYQKSIVNQFEFVQGAWVNEPDFPQKGDGVDPIIHQREDAKGCPFHLPIGGKPKEVSIQNFVTTTGGEYFFQPSLPALEAIAKGKI